MKKLVTALFPLWLLAIQSTTAIIGNDTNHPYHFIADENLNNHFFHIGKSAFRLLEIWTTDEQQAKNFIDDAHANGINTLRIFLM